HGAAGRFESLRNCQFSSYVGSGYLRSGSGVGVWAVAGEAARTADVTRTKLQRQNIAVLPHERLGRGLAVLKTAKSRLVCGPRVRDALFVGNVALANIRACLV